MLVKQRIYISLLLLSLLPITLVAVLTEKVEEDIIEQLITRDLQSLAREKSLGIERLLDERIHEVRLIARHPALVKRVQDSNKQYQNRNHQEVLQEIQLLDENWITHKGSTPRAQSVAINELSKLLLEIQTSHPEVYGEMFVTDALGATVAMTKTLSDYYQADEYWWQKGLDYAEKGAFLDDRGYDESVGAIVIGVVVPIVDNGIVVGMFKVNFLVKAVIDIVAGETLEEGYSLLLGRSDGSVIIGSQERYPDRLSQDALEAIRTVPEGGWISTLQGEENFAVYYPVKQRFITRETKSPQIGGVNEVTSEKTWYLVYEVEHDVAFAALQDLHETVIKMGGGAFLLAILMGFLLSRSISNPLAVLKRGIEIIGAGNLNYYISLKEKNEFGMLADSFNSMSKKLQESLASRDELDREIKERKIVEKDLNRFKTTLDLTLDCVFMFHAESLKFFYVNRGGVQQVGYTLDELFGMTPLDIKPEFDEQSFRKICLSLIEQPENPTTFETVHKTKQGKLIPVEVFLQYVVPDEGEPRFVAIVRDITERKKQQEEQAAYFKRVNLYQDTLIQIAANPATPVGGVDVIYPFITQSVAQLMEVERVSIWMFESEPEEGIVCVDLYQKSLEQHSREGFFAISDCPDYFQELYEGGLMDIRQVATDSRTRLIFEKYLKPFNIQSILNAPVYLEGKLVGVVCCESVGKERIWQQEDQSFVREVAVQVAQILSNARRRYAEEELNEARILLKDVIDSMPSVLVAVDGQRRITQWSQGAENITGRVAREVMGMALEEGLLISEGVKQRVIELLDEHKFQSLLRQECFLNGKKQFVDVTVYPLTGEQADGSVIRLDDVTERVRIESMMSQTEKMMSIGGLAAGMAHELNNPLAGILQGMQNIRRRFSLELAKNVSVADELGLELEKVHQYMDERQISNFIENIEQSSSRAAQIVANLVKFIRHPDQGVMAENLNELIERTIELALMDYDMKKKYGFRELKIVREFDDELMSVPCVASEIQQVVLNGLRNSAQALSMQKNRNDDGEIIIRTKKEDKMVRVEIEDNGPGLDKQTLSRVFEPFFTTRDPGVGTGLGLSVSYYIIHDQHQGSLSMESSLGQGAKLIVELPLEVQSQLEAV